MDLWNVGILPQYYMASQPRMTRILTTVKTLNHIWKMLFKHFTSDVKELTI
jgi:hypothetical protein